MATRKKTAASDKKKSGSKQVIEHDPFSMSEEDESSKPIQAEKVEEVTKNADSEKEAASAEPTEGNGGIDLGSSLVISEVEICRTALLNALQGGGDLVLDGGEIEQIDGAGLQLLASFAKEVSKTGVTYKWGAASHVLCESASRLGLSEVLQLNEA